MHLTRYNPYWDLNRFGRSFDASLAGCRPHNEKHNWTGLRPRVDIRDEGNELIFEFDIPGLKKEDIKVKIDNEKNLIVSGEKRHVKVSENEMSLRKERIHGEFKRVFQLPDTIESDKIAANYDNGVLKISIGKKNEPGNTTEIMVN